MSHLLPYCQKYDRFSYNVWKPVSSVPAAWIALPNVFHDLRLIQGGRKPAEAILTCGEQKEAKLKQIRYLSDHIFYRRITLQECQF